MTLNDNVRIDMSRVSKRSGSRRGGIIAGGGIGVVLLALGSQLLGINLMPFAPVVEQAIGGGAVSEERTGSVPGRETGADANTDVERRMAAASDSLERYWATQVGNYRGPATVVLFEGRTESGCGAARRRPARSPVRPTRRSPSTSHPLTR